MRYLREITFDDGKTIDAVIDIGKRKNLYIQIVEGQLIIKSPPKLDEAQMIGFVKSREDWIFKSVESSKAKPKRLQSFENGEEFTLLGRIVKLEYIYPEKYKKAYFDGASLKVSVNRHSPDIDSIKRDCTHFINDFANSEIKESCTRLIKKTKLCPKKITIKKMKSCWGRCSSNGAISLNFYLFEQTKEQMDYVVIHELCHLVHMNHSEKFWTLVSSFCPEWKRIRKELNYND